MSIRTGIVAYLLPSVGCDLRTEHLKLKEIVLLYWIASRKIIKWWNRKIKRFSSLKSCKYRSTDICTCFLSSFLTKVQFPLETDWINPILFLHYDPTLGLMPWSVWSENIPPFQYSPLWLPEVQSYFKWFDLMWLIYSFKNRSVINNYPNWKHIFRSKKIFKKVMTVKYFSEVKVLKSHLLIILVKHLLLKNLRGTHTLINPVRGPVMCSYHK